MKGFFVLLSYELRHQIRSRWIFANALFYLGVGIALLQFGGDSKKFTASFLNVVILFNPAIAILYSTVHWYANQNFNRLILTQPIGRRVVFVSSWLATLLGLSGAFVIGCVGAQILAGSLSFDLFHLLCVGLILNAIFTGIGILWAVAIEDRMKGLAGALGTWLYLSVLHDGAILLLLVLFRDYPMEVPAFTLLTLNPIDLSRLYLLFQFDLAALMGYTGSLLQRMAQESWSWIILFIGILVWGVLPFFFLDRLFRHKDL